VNAEELTAALREEGFEYLSTTKALRYINDAYLLDICEEEDWPFLEATAEGAAPLEISDLRAVESVIDSTQEVELRPLDRRHIVADVDTNLTTVGTPAYYYLTEGKTVNVYPISTTDTLKVRYWKVPTELSGTASPLLPTRFHSLIVDGAVARAYENSDDHELRQVKEEVFQARLARMRESLGLPHRDGPDTYVELTDPEGGQV
jgi:hypothetical protein